MQHATNPMGTLVPILIALGLMVLRMRRMTGVRPMRLQYLWIRPAIFVVIAAVVIYYVPPQSAVQALILLAVLGVSALLGWHQGKLMVISVDATSGKLQVKASMWAMIAFIGILLLRWGLRPWLASTDSPVRAYVGTVTDGSLLFIVGFYSARATEMFIRGRALLLASQGQSKQPG